MIAGGIGLTRAGDAVKCVLLFPVTGTGVCTPTEVKIRASFSISGVNVQLLLYMELKVAQPHTHTHTLTLAHTRRFACSHDLNRLMCRLAGRFVEVFIGNDFEFIRTCQSVSRDYNFIIVYTHICLYMENAVDLEHAGGQYLPAFE